MSPSHVFEPTYEAIRNRLMAGAWPMGIRLEAGRLANELGVSITPVRDSLNRLVGEKLVELVPGIGFHVPHLSEKRFRDLLDLNLTLLLTVLEIGARQNGVVMTELPAGDHAERTSAVFSCLAAFCGNEDIVGAVQTISARLHATRLHERTVLSDAGGELDSFQIAMVARDCERELGYLLRRYHEVRKREASRLVALLQSGNTG